jgi:DNA-binding PadR family transcriptional regulator
MTDRSATRGSFLALLALQHGAKHGYEICNWVRERTKGLFTLSFGALYPILHQLEKDGLIEGTWEEATPARRRKVYALTEAGRIALAEERGRVEETLLALGRLLGSEA